MPMKNIFIILLILIADTKSYTQINKERIAILDFELLSNEDNLSKYKWITFGFAETLTDAFSRISEFTVIERSQLSRIIKEQELQRKLIIDSNSIVKIGKLLGVNKVLLGSCQIATGHILVNMRIVNVETGQIYPLKKLPIIKPIDSVLFIQKAICLEILNQFKISSENYSEELKSINQITTSSTKNIRAYEFLIKGIELYNNQQYKDAIEMYNFALEIDRKYSKAYYKRGIVNFLLNNYGRAASDFERSDKYIKKDSIFYLMGNAYQKQGLTAKAYHYYKQAEKLNPTSFAIRQSLFEIDQSKMLISINEIPKKADDSTFQTIFEYKDGIAKVRRYNKYGYIDTADKIVVPLIFDEIRNYNFGLAAAKVGNSWGFIDKKGNWIIDRKFMEGADFNELGLSGVMHKNKWGVINRNGTVIVPFKYNKNWEFSFSKDSLILVSEPKNSFSFEDLWGIYDITGRLIIPVIYDDIDYSYSDLWQLNESNPYLNVCYKGKWGVIDKNNKIIVPFKYETKECIRKFKNGYATVKVNEKWGVVNEKGIEIIPPKFDQIKEHSLGCFAVKIKIKWGVVDLNDSLIIPVEYEDINHVGKKYWAAKKEGHWGVIDTTNKVICNFVYEGYEPGHTLPSFDEVIIENGKIIKKQRMNEIAVPFKRNGSYVFINEKCETIN